MGRAGLLPVLLAAALSVGVGAQAQGLGDAAKREKERRSKAKVTDTTPTKGYTDEDIVGRGGGSVQYGAEAAPAGDTGESSSADTPAPAAASAPLAGRSEGSAHRGSEAAGARGESYWRSRAKAARDRVAAAEKAVSDLEAEATRNGPLMPGFIDTPCQEGVPVGRDGTSIPAIELRDMAKKGQRTCDGETMRHQQGRAIQGKLESAKANLASARQDLEALGDEARRAGALPGWLR